MFNRLGALVERGRELMMQAKDPSPVVMKLLEAPAAILSD